jgi:hypothetical protein
MHGIWEGFRYQARAAKFLHWQCNNCIAPGNRRPAGHYGGRSKLFMHMPHELERLCFAKVRQVFQLGAGVLGPLEGMNV